MTTCSGISKGEEVPQVKEIVNESTIIFSYVSLGVFLATNLVFIILYSSIPVLAISAMLGMLAFTIGITWQKEVLHERQLSTGATGSTTNHNFLQTEAK